MAAGNDAINQAFITGKVNWSQVGSSALTGGVMGGATMGLSAAMGPLTSSIAKNIHHDVLGNALSHTAAGGISGFTLGGGGQALLDGKNISEAWQAGKDGFYFGMAVGTVSGVAAGARQAHNEACLWWRGIYSISVKER